jgi:NAD(P)-dependent dehydrogenase (short-subunit alcohol dehydrogenase family)
VRCDGQSVVVVGAGSGIGSATAQVFARHGASVICADIDGRAAEETRHIIATSGSQAVAVPCDITSREAVTDLFERSVDAFGRIDILVSTVGWADTTFFVNESEDYWERIVQVNLMGAFYLCHEVLRYMIPQSGGSIVLTSSDAGKVGTMGETVYAAAKAGVIGFVKSLAREVARDNIRVNAVSPGPTDTPLLRAQADQDVIERMVRSVPLKRMGRPVEQANAIVFLASDSASYITGQTLSVSGGLTMSS